MENSWHMNCDSSFQPSTPAIVSQEPKSQMELSTSSSLYQRVGYRGLMQEHNYPSSLHSNSHGSPRADSGNSFLALLSGSPSLLQCDFNELSDPKPWSFSGNLPAAGGNLFVDSIGNGTLLTSGGGLITENDSKAAAQSTVPGSEKAREPPSPRGQFCWTGPASTLNFYSSESHTMPSEEISNKQASPFMSGCPRVFCMGKSGYLLLSNTGLLGVVCSCHCCHMSVLKFCEHSGLRDVDPGEAVCMESGETIAQWRKFYFLKFGIRSPGNDSEWDWPEVLSTTASLKKSNVSAANALKIDSSHLCNLSTVLSRAGKPSDGVMFQQNVPTDHSLFIGLSKKHHASIQNSCDIPLRGFASISQSNLHDMAVDHAAESNLASQTVAPNFVGTQVDDGCLSIPACVGPLKRNGKSSTAPLLMQNLELTIESNANDGLVGRDAAISNIELRLGQPPHRRGNPVPSITESHLFDALVTPSKFQPLKETVHNNFQRKEEEFWKNFCPAVGPSNSKIIEEQTHVELRNYTSGHIDVGSARARLHTDIVAKESVILPPSHINPQLDSNAHPKTNEILQNDGGLNLPDILPAGSIAMQFHPIDTRQWSTYASNSHKFLENDNGVSCDKNSCVKTDLGFRISKLMENPGHITRAVGGSSNCCISAANGKNYESYNESSMMLDAYVGKNISCCPERSSSLGQDSHLTWQSIGTQLPSGMSVPSEGILMGLSFPVSAYSSNQTPILLQQEGFNMDTHMLDENTRLLALTQVLDISKQQQALYLHEVNKIHWRSSNCSEVQNSLQEVSVSKQGTSDPKLLLPQNNCGNPGDVGRLASFAEGLNSYCRLSTLASMCLHPKERNLQCEYSHDLLQNEEPSLRLGRCGGITGSSECERCSEQPSDTHLGVKYNCATQVNFSGSNFTLGIGPIPCTLGKQIANANGETSLMVASKLTKDQNVKIGSHSSQWRDVPCNVNKGVSDARSLDQPANFLGWGWQDEDQLGNFTAKHFKRSIHVEDSLKEQESSNVFSGCSAPAVTQASVEVNNVDSSTVDAIDNGYMDNFVGDEGSGIDKSWSSDALGSERSAELLGSSCETYMKKGYSRVFIDLPHRSLLDEIKLLDSLTWKKGWAQNHNVLSANCKTNQSQKVKKGLKGKKRKRVELRMLDATMPPRKPSLSCNGECESTELAEFPSSLSKEMQMSFASKQQRFMTHTCFIQPNIKQCLSTLSSKVQSCKNNVINHCNGGEGQGSYESESNFDDELYKFPKVSGRKKQRKDPSSNAIRQFQVQTPAQTELENANLKSSCIWQATACNNRPVVCGKYGEICCQNLDEEVPMAAKIVSLTKVLKTSKRCGVRKNDERRLTLRKKRKKSRSGTSDVYEHFSLKANEAAGSQNAIVCDETNVDTSMEDLKSGNKPPVTCKVKGDIKDKQDNNIVVRTYAPLKLKSKEIRQRSIHELTAKETKVKKILEYAQDGKHGLCNTNSKKSAQEERSTFIQDSNAFCCVCRSSSNDEINCLLKCNQCLIRVHQACYGISLFPKGRWYCRPCRTNSKDIACVLCGYGGGAMTRALRSCTIVKSLLKVWNIEKGDMRSHATPSNGFKKDMEVFHSTKSGLGDQKYPLRHKNTHTLATDLWKAEMSANHMQHAPCCNGDLKIHNSITAGVLDRTVKQWVHMVCGLWTPQTRCPNVDTMSAFDVSGVLRPRADVVCSICNRWGGSCIDCRVVNCTVKFHPWCAHQKGLLQSETEGVDDEKVGFYGRCPLHAIDPIFSSKHESIDSDMCCLEEKNLTCARTEGYKGRRRDGFRHNHYNPLKGRGGCLVPQEQLNAWIHINGQKLCSQGLSKFPVSDVEYDCRKEYARYNQLRGWKHLVVYKSGIHALGLYTSRFISRGEMVVEYVGEIVGLRVADKREKEYQSGRKLQYESACYFFRIDKEHIIDATRKGGIARFVNHSCLPNCVAKVITVRQEQKVVFFAERDIFPGEEITYDYHFNHEDEGKKIPCYCNSINCRRYLN